MTLADFLAGKLFNYTGNFQRIAQRQDVFSQEKNEMVTIFQQWQYDPNTGKILSKDRQEFWWMDDVFQNRAKVSKSGFPNVFIMFSDCQLVEEVQP
jgi:hypothetical protein